MKVFGHEFKKLGFGLMRPPLKDGEIDMPQFCNMIDAYMDAGFNYFDTAWAYAGSEKAIKKALVERYPRDSYFIVTKIAPWIKCQNAQDMHNQFEESLKDSGLDYFDLLLVHNVGAKRTIPIREFEAWKYVEEQKANGRAHHIGWSTHGTAEEIEEYFKETPGCEMIQLQINYADWNSSGYCERECYEAVTKLGVPIVVMEPVKGGMLANPPKAAQAVLEKANPNRTPIDWALSFPASLDNVAVVLSGMSSIEQMKQNIELFKDFKPLSDAEFTAVKEAQKAIEDAGLIPCTGCNYCSKVCPMDIGISGSFEALNNLKTFDDIKVATWQLGTLVSFNGHKMPTECTKCGACEEACPQNIAIRENLDKVLTDILPYMDQRPSVNLK
ncbi:MAG: aldo/keto reductase [Coriobacteriales bacterium]|nr:aldo/keto reductase [Coriobacteriales bacterium]